MSARFDNWIGQQKRILDEFFIRILLVP